MQEELARARAPELVGRIGINLVGPTLLAHGTPEQKARWLPRILDADELWCQLFSEPGAGSDLAAVATKAERVDGGWSLNGQKVWTCYAQFADWGLCLARTDPDAPKNQGISSFAVDMRADGVEVRPLVQITGEAEFNEVFFDDVFVPDDQLIGAENDGWQVSNSTLTHERGTNPRQLVIHAQLLEELLRAGPRLRPLRRPSPAAEAGRGVRRGAALPAPQLALAVPPGRRHGAGPRGQLAQALLERDEQAPARDRHGRARRRRAALAGRRRTTPATASGSGRGSTTRRPRSSPGRTRSSAPSSASGSWACPDREAACDPASTRRAAGRPAGARPRHPHRAPRSAPACWASRAPRSSRSSSPAPATSCARSARSTSGYSLFWAVEGRGRKSVTLDLRQADGQALLRRLAATADVLVENFRPGTLERWNIAPDALPDRLVTVRISSFGQDGPNAERPGLDRLGIGFGGLMHLTGYPDRPPVRVGVTISDYLTGVFAAQAATAALYERDAEGDRPGRGHRRRPLRRHPPHPRVDPARLRPARRGPLAGGQPAGQLGAARQLPDRRRQVRLHRGRQRRQLPPAVHGDGTPRPADRPPLRHAAEAGRPERRDQRRRRRRGP